MLEPPPSAPADHAEDFSWRYADHLDIVVGQAMLDLGVPENQMGERDPLRRSEHHTFFPGDREGGTVSLTGRITLDSGLMNPELMANYDDDTRSLWRRTRLRDRAEAIIAHELTEHELGNHQLALIAGPHTELPISDAARELLRQMELGWKGR